MNSGIRRIIVFGCVFTGVRQDQMGSSDTKSTQTALAEPREKQTKQKGMHVKKTLVGKGRWMEWGDERR